MAVREGPNVKRIEKKLEYESEDLLTIGSIFAIILLFAIAFSTITFGRADFFAIIVSFIVIFFGIAGLMGAIKGLSIDVQEFVEAFRQDNPDETDIAILEEAYSLARKYAKNSLSGAIMAWLTFGIYAGVIEIAALEGVIPLEDYRMLGILHILSFVGFILMIVLYLRKRSIEKALFAIQLKKSDKAEISIKI
jgi:hypothetical protein